MAGTSSGTSRLWSSPERFLAFSAQMERERHRVGYLPEERGLYRNISSIEILVYLGQLKGMSRHRARERAKELLERLDMATHARR